MKTNIDRLTGLFLFGTALMLRMALVSKGPYHGDCLTLAYLADQTLQTHQIHALLRSPYPLTTAIGALFIFFFRSLGIQDIVTAVNYMSVFFSSLCVLIFYHFVKRVWKNITAIMATIFFIVSPIFLGTSVYGNSQMLSLFFLLLSVYVLCTCYSQRFSWRYLILSAFFLGLGGACRIQDMVCFFIPLSFFILIGQPSMNLKVSGGVSWPLRVGRWVVFVFISLLPSLIFHLTSYDFGSKKMNFISKNLIFLSEYPYWLLGRNTFYLYTNFSPLGVLLVLVGIILFIMKKERHLVFLLLWVLMPLMFYSLFNFSVPRYLLLSLIPLYVFLGYFFHDFFQRGKMFRIFGLVSTVFIIFLNMQFIVPPLHFRHNHSVLIDYAQWIQSHTEEDAQIFAGDDRLTIQYYAQRKMLQSPISYYEPIADEALYSFKEKIDGYLVQGIPLYMSESVFAYDPGLKMRKFLQENYHIALWGQPEYECWHRGLFKHRVFKKKFLKIFPKDKGQAERPGSDKEVKFNSRKLCVLSLAK